MRKALSLSLMFLLLSGCLRHAVRMTNRWRGHSIQEAVSEMGPPDSVTPNGATTIYLWTTSRAHVKRWATVQERTCEGWFSVETSTGTIQNFNERGDDC